VHTFFVGNITTSWSDDFETDKGWTVGAPGDQASTGVWERCDPEYTEAQPEDDHTDAPGTLAYITECAAGTGVGSYDVDGGATTLTSPNLDLSSLENAYLRYWLWYVNDAGSTPGTDYWLAQVSDDGGSSWTTVDSTYASNHAWTLIEHDLEQHINLTGQVQARFVAGDRNDGSIVEAGVDDFSIVTYETISTGVAGAAPSAERIVLHRNVPNPFNPTTTIRFEVPAPGRTVSLKIYDLTGREVRGLVDGEKVAGARSVVWDGRNDEGRAVTSGVYFYRLDAGKDVFSHKLVLIR